MHLGTRVTVLLGTALVATVPAHAEVMDKEPSIAEHWIWALAAGFLAILGWRWRWWAGLLVTVVGVLAIPGFYFELNDRFVGPAIRAEAGSGYVANYYASAVVWLALNAVAVYGWLLQRRKKGRLAT